MNNSYIQNSSHTETNKQGYYCKLQEVLAGIHNHNVLDRYSAEGHYRDHNTLWWLETSYKLSNQNFCVCLFLFNQFIYIWMSFSGNSYWPPTMFLQSMLGSCTNRRGTKTGATILCMKWIKEAQVWISSDLGLEQSGKSTPSLLNCCRKGKLSCLDVCLSVKKNLFLAE